MVAFAKLCEDVALKAHQEKPLGVVTYGVLVGSRRLAEAILVLGTNHAYEARILMRGMVEHYFNLAWIRLRASARRANRFAKFQAIERLRLFDSLPREMLPTNADEVRRGHLRARAKYRHLFLRRTKKGGLRWDADWSGGLSFEGRVKEVVAKNQRQPDEDREKPFVYSLYRWFSGPMHGSANHLYDILVQTRWGVRPKPQPESRPCAAMLGATLLLLGVLTQVSQVINFSPTMISQLERMSSRCLADDGNTAAA